MVNPSDFEKLPLFSSDFDKAVDTAVSEVYKKDIYNRDTLERCIDRAIGLLSECGFINYMHENGINCTNFHECEPEHLDRTGNIDIEISAGGRNLTVETKSSHMPYADGSLDKFAERCNIPVTKRTNSPEKDFSRDVYFEILVNKPETSKYDFINLLYDCGFNGNPKNQAQKDLLCRLLQDRYDGSLYLTCWNSRKNILNYLDGLDEKTWHHKSATYWKAPIMDAYPPQDLFHYLRIMENQNRQRRMEHALDNKNTKYHGQVSQIS